MIVFKLEITGVEELFTNFTERIMDAFAELKTEIAAEKQQVTDAITALTAQVTALQAQLASGSQVTDTQLAELKADLQSIFTPAPPAP